MDTKMDVDVGKVPEPHRLSPTSEPASIPTLDGWIENLMNCKQLAENDVQRLCDRVISAFGGQRFYELSLILLARRVKYYKTSQTSNLW